MFHFQKRRWHPLFAWENRELDEALTLAETAVKSDGQPAHRATLALVYHRLNRFSEARREIKNAFTQAPDHPYILKDSLRNPKNQSVKVIYRAQRFYIFYCKLKCNVI